MREADKDKDGKISLEEFKTVRHTHVHSYLMCMYSLAQCTSSKEMKSQNSYYEMNAALLVL